MDGQTACHNNSDCPAHHACCRFNDTTPLYYCCPANMSSRNILWMVGIFFGVSVILCFVSIVWEKVKLRCGRRRHTACMYRQSRCPRRVSPVSRRRHVSVRVNTTSGSSNSQRAPLSSQQSVTSTVDVPAEIPTSHPPPYAVVFGAGSSTAQQSRSASLRRPPPVPQLACFNDEPPNYSADEIIPPFESPPDYDFVEPPSSTTPCLESDSSHHVSIPTHAEVRPLIPRRGMTSSGDGHQPGMLSTDFEQQGPSPSSSEPIV